MGKQHCLYFTGPGKRETEAFACRVGWGEAAPSKRSTQLHWGMASGAAAAALHVSLLLWGQPVHPFALSHLPKTQCKTAKLLQTYSSIKPDDIAS